MDVAVVVSIISVVGGILAAAASYGFTKQREREVEWRREKLTHYKAFVESLSGILEAESTPEGQRAFAKAGNNLLLFAPQKVIEALDAFRSEIRVSNPHRSEEKHDELLAALLLAIRKDVGVRPSDEPRSFRPRLWASGVKQNAP